MSEMQATPLKVQVPDVAEVSAFRLTPPQPSACLALAHEGAVRQTVKGLH